MSAVECPACGEPVEDTILGVQWWGRIRVELPLTARERERRIVKRQAWIVGHERNRIRRVVRVFVDELAVRPAHGPRRLELVFVKSSRSKVRDPLTDRVSRATPFVDALVLSGSLLDGDENLVLVVSERRGENTTEAVELSIAEIEGKV